MTLRQRAEEAALSTWRKVNSEFSHHGPLAGDRIDIGLIADAIERVAIEFAEKALREVITAHEHPNLCGMFVCNAFIVPFNGLYGLAYSTLDEAAKHRDFAIGVAITNAEST